MIRPRNLAVPAFFLALVILPTTARAGYLPFSAAFENPDVFFGFNSSSFTPDGDSNTSELFKIDGYGSLAGGLAVLKVRAHLTETGVLDTNELNELQITNGSGTVSFLAGIITDVYVAMNNIQFEAQVISEDVAALGGSYGGLAGVIYNNSNGINLASGFNYTFANGGSTNVGRPVPEPGSLAIFGSFVALGCCRFRRRRAAA